MLRNINVTGLGDDGFEIPPLRAQGADLGRLVNNYALGRSNFLRLECTRANIDDRARRYIATHMSAHLSAEFLAHHFEPAGVNPVDVKHVGDISRIQLDGKAWRQIDSEMGVRDEHDTVARNDVYQGFADQFSVGVVNSLIRDFPNLTVRGTQAFANSVKLCAPTGNDSHRRHSSVNLFRGSCEFSGRFVGHAAPMYDVGEDPRH